MIAPPRLPLAALPTPLQHRPDLGAALGRKAFWVKRDDLTGYSWGGNKVRTIEYLLGDAEAQACDTVVLCGGPTSNFAALMAAACAARGLATIQVSYGTEPDPKPAALAAGEAAGAAIRYTGSPDRARMEDVADALAETLRGQGRRPYPVPRGGATVVGAFGYAHAAGEVRRQLRQVGVDAVTLVIPVGSGGSIAGLLAGFLFNFEGDEKETPLDLELIGVSVSRPPEELREGIDAKARACGAGRSRLANVNCRWELVDGRGAGFNHYDSDDAAFVDDIMRCSGLLIDTTYNGKALRWLCDLLPETNRPILYWHTGGSLAVADRLGTPGHPSPDHKEIK
ncbi:hypothetical protein CAF53_22510 [Sphingobium sp. LB126]|uniref:1-aminocyclopropane-1-carboxylate deaminase/D-cysteine desulfhydrase n=1 Tax=Sphingobium sp. LB126 TaxID=1983755 RepID=UPI000C206486|nr:pyridoxal-phosphate dependent enzyme [Sphingobium sp. LB126]PJG45514.1 hypothetical protein CAF53_22510 [Sphingobium sp. LB126]